MASIPLSLSSKVEWGYGSEKEAKQQAAFFSTRFEKGLSVCQTGRYFRPMQASIKFESRVNFFHHVGEIVKSRHATYTPFGAELD